MKICVWLVFLAVTVAAVTAQTHEKLPKIDRWMVAGVAAARVNDALSTRYMLRHGWHEKFLPDVMAHSEPAMLGFAAATTYAQYRASCFLARHHQRWLATATEALHIAEVGYWSANNWRASQ